MTTVVDELFPLLFEERVRVMSVGAVKGVNELARASPLPLGEDGRAKREPDRAKHQERPGEGKIRHVSSVPSPERAKKRRALPSPRGRGLPRQSLQQSFQRAFQFAA